MTEEKQNTLVSIQSTLKAPKGQHNKFGNYDYRSAEDILNALKPILRAMNATLTLADEPVLVGDWHYIKATATLVTKENTYTGTGFARESPTKKGMDDSQITGTASSYARKYALNGLFLIDDTKDADTNEYRQQQAPQRNTKQYHQPPKKQDNSVIEAKRKLFKGRLAQIAKALNSNSSVVSKEIIKQAETKPEYQQAVGSNNEDRKATILLNLAEIMFKQVQSGLEEVR